MGGRREGEEEGSVVGVVSCIPRSGDQIRGRGREEERVESSGVEWSGVEWSGVEWCVVRGAWCGAVRCGV